MVGKSLFRAILFGTAGLALGQIPLDSLHGSFCGMIEPVRKVQVAISPSFTRVNVVVTDAIAQVTVTQKFVNPFGAKSEAVYIFPLPDQGSVHAMKYQYHDSIYIAEIMEKGRAQTIYDSVKNSGGQAALLLQERPNIFMQRIATLGAGDTAYIEIKLSMPLKIVDGELELAFPTRIGQRYPSGTPGSGGDPWNPPENRLGPEFQFNVLVESGLPLSSISSPSHPIEISDFAATKNILVDRQVLGGDVFPKLTFVKSVLLLSQTTYPNRDYVLRLRRARTAPEFSLAVSQDPNGQGFFMLNMFPDPSLFAGNRPDLEVVLLVDISGSQSGWPLAREKEISLNILSRLTPNDNIDVLAFNDNVYYAYGKGTPVSASPQNIAIGENFVRGLNAMGSTQLLEGVNAALAVPVKADKKRIFIFLTDGFITNETAILAAISNHPSSPTVFTFGAGNSLNRYFLEECAKVGNGFSTPMVEGDAVGPLVDAAWQRIQAPQMEHLQLSMGGLATSDLLYPVSNSLYLGMPYRVLGKFTGGGAHTLTLTGDQNGKPVSFSKVVDFSSTEALAWAVPKLWAREKIGQMMLAQGATETNRAAITAVSLKYQVLCAYTAFLAAHAQAATQDNSISGGLTGITEFPFMAARPPSFDLSMHGGLLLLDWKGAVEVESILIYDMQGRLLFSFHPGVRVQRLVRWVWDGKDSQGHRLGVGRYLVRVNTSGGMESHAFNWNPTK